MREKDKVKKYFEFSFRTKPVFNLGCEFNANHPVIWCVHVCVCACVCCRERQKGKIIRSRTGLEFWLSSVHVNHNRDEGFLTAFVTLFTDVGFKGM